jgi:NADH-quinone oxidoreductase subunit K
MTLTLGHFLSLGAMLFALSVIGIFLNRKNLIVLLMCIELMLLAVNVNFVAFSYFLGDMHGQIFVFFILTVAAAESAIGLALLVLLFRNKSNINVDEHFPHPHCWPCRWRPWSAPSWPACSAPSSAATTSAAASPIR